MKETVNATVVGRRMVDLVTLRGLSSPYRTYATFRFTDGTQKEFEVPPRKMIHLREDQRGMLTYKKENFKKFVVESYEP